MTEVEKSARQQPLKPVVSMLGAFGLAFGCAVGWGAFVMPGASFLPKAGPLGTVLGVAIGGLIMTIIAWNYHFMINKAPGSGGAYSYVCKAFGIDHGFLCVWFLVLVYVAIAWANATALAIVARYTLGEVFRLGFRYTVAGYEVCLGDILLADAAIVIGAVLCLRRRLSCTINAIFAVGFALGIIVCIVAVFAKHTGGIDATAPAFAPANARHFSQILKIVSLSPCLFVGFEGISHASGEFTFPRRRSFAIMLVALIVSIVAYSSLAILPALLHPGEAWPEYLVRVSQIDGVTAIPTFHTAATALGRTGSAVMGATMFGAIFTGIVGNFFNASRQVSAVAEDGIIPSRYSRRNFDGAPVNAVIAIAAISLVVPFIGRTAIGFIVDVSTVGAAIAYGYTSVAAWQLSRNSRLTRFTGVCGLMMSVTVLILFILPNYVSGTMMATESYLFLVLWSIIGLTYFFSVSKRDKHGRFAKSTVVWIAMLLLISAMSFLWMRQNTSDATRMLVHDIVRLHDTLVPHPDHINRDSWILGMKDLQLNMDAMLLRGGLVQIGLLSLAFAILYSLYTTLRKRELTLMREKMLRQYERDLECEKAQTRSYFFSTVSHDIRTPLNAIIGFSELLNNSSLTEQERNQAVESIIISGKTLLALINDVLDLSKLESGKMEVHPEPTDCGRLLRDVFEVFRVAKNKSGVELRDKTGEMPILMLDPLRLRQIVFNLVGNAVKFTANGYIELRSSYIRDGGADSGTFMLEVEDTGCGISERDLKRIASPYVQVGSKHGRNGGTGLGLAICRQLAKTMGGELRIASVVGKGSIFTIEIKNVKTGGAIAPQRPVEIEKSQEPDSAAPSHPLPKRILIVDDQKMNLMVLKSMLKKKGDFEILTAENGSEAFELLLSHDTPTVDLVLTDLWMPELDGEGLVRAIRSEKALSSLRVIAVTADVEIKDRYAEMGFDGIMLKPLTMESLAAFI